MKDEREDNCCCPRKDARGMDDGNTLSPYIVSRVEWQRIIKIED